jgi:hypothetical protein
VKLGGQTAVEHYEELVCKLSCGLAAKASIQILCGGFVVSTPIGEQKTQNRAPRSGATKRIRWNFGLWSSLRGRSTDILTHHRQA